MEHIPAENFRLENGAGQILEKTARCASDLAPLVEQFAEEPWDDDPILAAFYKAAHDVLTSDRDELWRKELLDVIDFSLSHRLYGENRPALKVQPAVNMLQRFMMMEALARDPECFPSEKYERPRTWTSVMRNVGLTPQSTGQLAFTYLSRTVQSNIPDRFAGIKWIALSEQDRVTSKPSYLEVGCSTQQGQAWLKSNKPAHHIDVMWAAEAGESEPGAIEEKIVAHKALTKFVNKYVNKKLRIGENWGIDPMPVEGINEDWQFACSFRPHELYDESRITLWKELAALKRKDKNIQFLLADFSPLDSRMHSFAAEASTDYFNLVAMPTMLYQFEEDEQKEKIEFAKQFVDPEKGLMIIQDFAYADENDPSKLLFLPQNKWNQWGAYRTFLADPKEDFKKYHEIFVFDSGRARQVMLGRDFGRLAISHEMAKHLKLSHDDFSQKLREVRDQALTF